MFCNNYTNPMKKLLLLLVFFSSFAFSEPIDMQSNCSQLASGDKMSLGNCVNAQMQAQAIFSIGAKVIEKQGWEFAAFLFSPIADIDTSQIEDNKQNIAMLKDVSLYITIEALFWFAVFMVVVFILGLLTQARTGKIFSMQNLYLLVWIFGGGGSLIYSFWKIVSIVAAVGIYIVLSFLATVVPIIAGLQEKDVKPINNELMISAKYKAEEIVDDLNMVNVTDFRNRKVILFNQSNDADYRGLKIEDRDFINCLRENNVVDAGDATMYTQNEILNTSFCATKVFGYTEYQVGYVSNSFESDETIEVMNKVKSLADKERRSYSYLVERNNCAYAYQAFQETSKQVYSVCMDMDADGNVKFGQASYLKPVTDPVRSNDSLKAIRASLVSELAVDIYTAALKGSAKVTPAKLSSGIGGVWDMINANNEYKINYRAAGLAVIDAVTINTEVRVKKNMVQSALDFINTNVVNEDEGVNNTFGLLDYAASLGADGQPINIFNSVNIVTGGAASLTGFNYTDCLNKTSCAIGSLDIAGRLTDATKSIVGPAFTGYLILTIASSVGKSENNKIVGKNKKVGSIEKPAKMAAGVLYAIAILIGFFYLKFCYDLFVKQLLKMLDWLFMVVIMCFTMFFAIFGLVISIITERKIDMNYFDFIRVSGIHDIAFRPLMMGVSWVGIVLVMYIMMGISSILIYNHLQEFVAQYSVGSVGADYVMQAVFNALYVFTMIYTCGKTLSAVDKAFTDESESMFTGLQNSLGAVDSVFSKIKGLSYANK